MPQYAGMPEDRSNYETMPDGSERVRIGLGRYMQTKPAPKSRAAEFKNAAHDSFMNAKAADMGLEDQEAAKQVETWESQAE